MRLRPIRESDLAVIERLDSEPETAGRFDWFGFRSTASRRRRYEEDGFLGREPYNLAVEADDGTFAGTVSWMSLPTGPTSSCWNVGIGLLPECQGRGLGTEAQRRLVDHLFRTTPANRIEASTDVENLPEQRALQKVGFTREGVLRGAQFREGEWRDIALYSVLRTEWTTGH